MQGPIQGWMHTYFPPQTCDAVSRRHGLQHELDAPEPAEERRHVQGALRHPEAVSTTLHSGQEGRGWRQHAGIQPHEHKQALAWSADERAAGAWSHFG